MDRALPSLLLGASPQETPGTTKTGSIAQHQS